ncbi:CE1759 family FMN reductase [Streptomyces sp. NPDC006012]|uniref:CE1759 family FMN reductase n=1 Tax=Streptomyces sp. NPDC006012 TaxID=3364739 RepID=UPI0036C735DE
MKLVVVSAGLGVPSSTRLLADRLAAATAADVATDVRVVEVRELAVAIAHHLTSGFPGRDLAAALDAVARADGLIVVTPVFTASYSGLFKSFFDLLEPDALAGKPVLIAATGGTARHSLVLEHALRPLFAYLKAVVVPTAVYAASEDWGAQGLAERIDRAAAELAGLMTGPAETSETRVARVAEGAMGNTAATPGNSGREAGHGNPGEPGPDQSTRAAGPVGRAAGASAAADLLDVVPFEEQLARLRAA